MITILNTNNHVISEINKNNDVRTDIQGENVEILSNMLVSILKSYRELGLNKEDLLGLVEISYEGTPNS